jgi:hypothetical protein
MALMQHPIMYKTTQIESLLVDNGITIHTLSESLQTLGPLFRSIDLSSERFPLNL